MSCRHTPLHDIHLEAGAELEEIDGWCLPRHYGAPLQEHDAVRHAAGVFDVSHLSLVDLQGEGTGRWLRTLLSNDVGRLDDGQALYACLCNERGGVIDDMIVYRASGARWRLSGNAATRERTLAWLEERRPEGVTVSVPDAWAMLAVQGPSAVELADAALATVLGEAPGLARLARFGARFEEALFVARTGFTGEDGVEIALPAARAAPLWRALLEAGVRPCGQQARDTLRIEAGLSRHGVELDEAHTPVESGLVWAVDLADPGRDFVGRERIEDQMRFGGCEARVGLVYQGTARRELRAGQSVQLAGRDVGVVTSGTFSPVRQQSIALARVARPFKGNCDVVISEYPLPACTVSTPFVRAGAAEGGGE